MSGDVLIERSRILSGFYECTLCGAAVVTTRRFEHVAWHHKHGETVEVHQ